MRIDTVFDFRRAVRMGPYAWPGGYPLAYVTGDGATLCHACATSERRSIADSISTRCDDGWLVIAVESTDSYDDVVTCDNCGTDINPLPEWVTSYVLPSYWAPYLINGDASDMTDVEMAEIERFISARNVGPCVGCGSDHWFAHRNDAGTLAGDVCRFDFDTRVPE